MALEPEVQTLADLFDANCAAFTAKDVDGYFASIHPDAWTFQGGAFRSIDELRAVAPQIFAISESFRVAEWIGGVVVGDTAALWGTFEYVVNTNDTRTTSLGNFSAHFTRADGEWLVLFTHYTPAA